MLFSKRTSFLLLLSGLILVTGFITGLHSTDAKDIGDDQSLALVKKEVVGRGIVYLSGGIGFEERNALEKMGRKYPLKLVFAVKGGKYLSDVKVRVYNEEGRILFKTVTNGPWLYIDMPDGYCIIKASTKRGTTKISEVKVSKGKQNVIVVSLP